MPDIPIRRIEAHEGPLLRDIRLRAFTDAPLAFGTTLVEASALPAEWWDARARACAAGTDRALWVAEDAARWRGLVGAEHSDVPGHFELISMWVDPAVRHRGVARRLLDVVTAWALQQRAVRLQLMVTEGNVAAIALYESVGFAFTGESDPHPVYAGLRELAMYRGLRES